jgi:hypothetical protein
VKRLVQQMRNWNRTGMDLEALTRCRVLWKYKEKMLRSREVPHHHSLITFALGIIRICV